MKKSIAIAVILAGVVLFTIGNAIQMYSTISIIEKRLAEKEHAVDTVEVKKDTMSFTEDSLKLVEYIRENAGTGYSNFWQVIQNSVLHNDEWYIPVVRYKNGFPKIAINVYFEKDIGILRKSYLFLDDAGRLIAFGKGSKHLGWSCYTRGDDNALILTFSNPNHCRNFHAIRSN